MFSKFGNKSIQKSLIFSNKANDARGLILFLIFLSQSCFATLAQETVYLTWIGSPSTTMTVQWISSAREKETTLFFKPLKDEQASWQKRTGQELKFPFASQYLVHRIQLDNLKPSTLYTFKILKFPNEYHFLTAPAKLDQDIRFVVGGDMYHDGISYLIRTNKAAAQTSPLFALIGGDIAYSVKSQFFGFQQMSRWIDWIKAWHEYMITPQGNMIPAIAAIGNHDLSGGYNQKPAQAAVFTTLFPMPGEKVYNVLDFNDYLSIFILDSGHANPVKGTQSAWLQASLNQRQHITHRLAIYHVPAYPSVREASNPYSAAIRQTWVPLFESGKIQAAFEHHDHAYKRTFPLLEGKVHKDGIVYFGDGGWGVEKPRTMKWRYPYLAKFSPTRHFIAVTLTPTEQRYQSISDLGQVIDKYTIELKQKISSPLNNVPVSLPEKPINSKEQ